MLRRVSPLTALFPRRGRYGAPLPRKSAMKAGGLGEVRSISRYVLWSGLASNREHRGQRRAPRGTREPLLRLAEHLCDQRFDFASSRQRSSAPAAANRVLDEHCCAAAVGIATKSAELVDRRIHGRDDFTAIATTSPRRTTRRRPSRPRGRMTSCCDACRPDFAWSRSRLLLVGQLEPQRSRAARCFDSRLHAAGAQLAQHRCSDG